MTGDAGFVLWFTGLSGAGKSTLARRVGQELAERGHRVEVLDGDEVRRNLCQGLGFSRADRDTNVARIGWVAGRLASHGVAVLVAAISPYAEAREKVRASVDEFVEVFVDAPLATCAERDPKGLYAKAMAGDVPNFTGVSDPYERPTAPEVTVHTDTETVDASVQRVLDALTLRGITTDPDEVYSSSEEQEVAARLGALGYLG